MFFNQTRVSERWSIHAEAQYRSYQIIPDTEQLLLRGGANYHIGNAAFASAGYAYIANYAYDKELMPGVQTSENRLWQQFFMKHNVQRVYLEHRYRLEQRWVHSGSGDRYLDRIGYLIRASIPANKMTIEIFTLFLTVYDELFVHFSNTPFDRNRLFGAIGYQFLPGSNIQLGYLAQTVNATTKYYLQAAVFYNLDLRKQD